MQFGLKALITAGFPLALCEAINLQIAECDHVSLALLVGQKPNTNKHIPVAPKPSIVKAKTSNHELGIPLVEGYIPWDQERFGRPGSPSLSENDDNLAPIQLLVSLYDIILGLREGHYELCSPIDDSLTLMFRAPKAVTQEKRNIVFKIDLSKAISPLPLSEKVVQMLLPWEEKQTLSQPNFWNTQQVNFNGLLHQLFSVSYRHANQEEFQPLMLAAMKEGVSGNRFPITGDADLLWVATPVKYAKEMNHKQYQTKIPKERLQLINDYISLYEDILDKKLVQPLSDEMFAKLVRFAERAGIITPYEFLIAMTVNEKFKKIIPHCQWMLQHGPDTNRPGDPALLDREVLHFYKGLPVLTENEDELVAFVMQSNYLEEHYIRVHPGWRMEKWAPVIEKQLRLNQDVRPETMESYHQYLRNKKNHFFSKVMSFFKEKRHNSSTHANFLEELGLGEIPYQPKENLVYPEKSSVSSPQGSFKLP